MPVIKQPLEHAWVVNRPSVQKGILIKALDNYTIEAMVQNKICSRNLKNGYYTTNGEYPLRANLAKVLRRIATYLEKELFSYQELGTRFTSHTPGEYRGAGLKVFLKYSVENVRVIPRYARMLMYYANQAYGVNSILSIEVSRPTPEDASEFITFQMHFSYSGVNMRSYLSLFPDIDKILQITKTLFRKAVFRDTLPNF